MLSLSLKFALAAIDVFPTAPSGHVVLRQSNGVPLKQNNGQQLYGKLSSTTIPSVPSGYAILRQPDNTSILQPDGTPIYTPLL